MNQQTSIENPKADDRRRWKALYVMCAGFLMITLDMTVVNVALPYIQDDLKFSTSSLAWVVNAYLIAFGGLLLLSGRLGDLIGRRTIFLVGMGIFTASSLLCGLSQTQEVLVIARFLQGIGGALSSAVILGMVVTLFPDPKDQAKAFGIYGFVASSGGAVGLLIGGVLTQALNWHWIFFVNLPIAAVTATMTLRYIDRDRGIGYSEGADVPGSVLITSGLMMLVYTIVKPAAELGWGASRTLVLLALSIGLLALFILRQATAAKPLMPLGIFKSRDIAGANLMQVMCVAGMFGVFFLGSLYLQRIVGYDAMKIGFAFLPTTLLMGLMSVRFSEPIIMKFGPRPVLVPSLALIGLSTLLFTRVPVESNYLTDLLPPMAALGLGGGLVFPALMNLAMSSAKPSEAGLASGLVNTTAQVGAALGLAILATISASRTGDLVADGRPELEALVEGYHFAFWVGTGLLGVAILVALLLLRAPAGSKPAEIDNEAFEIDAQVG